MVSWFYRVFLGLFEPITILFFSFNIISFIVQDIRYDKNVFSTFRISALSPNQTESKKQNKIPCQTAVKQLHCTQYGVQMFKNWSCDRKLTIQIQSTSLISIKLEMFAKHLCRLPFKHLRRKWTDTAKVLELVTPKGHNSIKNCPIVPKMKYDLDIIKIICIPNFLFVRLGLC